MKTGTIICLILFVIGAALTLIQMWFAPMSAALFTKTLITLGILFITVLSVILVKSEYVSDKKMKTGAIICLILFVISAALTLIQMWFTPMTASIFTQTLFTLGVILVVVLGVTIVKREYINNKKLKESGYID